MNAKLLKLSHSVLAMSLLAMTSCVDDDYDLSDIDTTAEFQVKDLVLPINIDEIKLQNIIEINEGSQISIVNDEYVFTEEGDFTSDNISIEKVTINAPAVESTTSTVELAGNIQEVTSGQVKTGNLELHYPIDDLTSPFTYETHSVSDFIVDMTKIGTEFQVKIIFSISGLEGIVKSYTLRGLELKVPKGLTLTAEGGTYNPETGILSLPDAKHQGEELAYTINVTDIDIDDAGILYDHDSHTIIFSDKVGIYDGELVVTESDFVSGYGFSNLPKTIKLHNHFDLSQLVINRFSGEIKYTLEGMDIAPISLTDIPDVLAQEETDIVLVNPQIYLKLNNPLAQYDLKAHAGITITAIRDNEPATIHTLDNDYFEIAGTAANPMNVFCLSPSRPEQYYGGYENAEHVPYSSLATVLSGNGLPSTLEVTLDDPEVPSQPVENLLLGTDLGLIHGNYTLFSPLELGAGTKIVYQSTEDGWNDEDVDAITIKKLEVSANVSNNLPLDIVMTGYPIDVNGNRINNVSIEGVEVGAGETDKPINIRITGEVTHLDGITFEAVAVPGEDNQILKPSEYIHLTNIKVKVSGNYIKEL